MRTLAVLAAASITALPLLLVPTVAASEAPSPSAQVRRTVTVTGTGVSSWPSYSPGVHRYGLSPTAESDGTVQVTASSSAPDGRIQVNGVDLASGRSRVLRGLGTGDEISVIFTDSTGTTAQSWIYLPVNFPRMQATGRLADPARNVFVTLSSFLSTTRHQAVLDGHGVPRIVSSDGVTADFKANEHQPGQYIVARQHDAGGYEYELLDERFRAIRRSRLTATPASTDFHDAEYLPDGRVLLLGYAPGTIDGRPVVNAVIEIQDAAGSSLFRWNSQDHVQPSEAYVDGGAGDYAHINSLQLLPNGDVLASFRNLSQIMRIATTAHDGFRPGEVIWRLGGRRNDFTIDDPGFGGPCAQHMARLLPDGQLEFFDNGSQLTTTGPIAGQSADMCPDPQSTDPANERIARPQSRVVRFALDETARVAARTWQFVPQGRYAAFAGNQQSLPDGNTFVGWSRASEADGSPAPVATEVAPDGTEVWRLSSLGWFSYRAFSHPAPDALPPTARLHSPADGVRYPAGSQVRARYTCTDTGGSDLVRCDGTRRSGQLVDTTPGDHVFRVTAADRAGNRTSAVASYHVPSRQPDLRIQRRAGTGLVGVNVYAPPPQHVDYRLPRRRTRLARRIVLTNKGDTRAQLSLSGTTGNRKFAVRYDLAGRNVTWRVTHGRYRVRLSPGQSVTGRVVFTRKRAARVGDRVWMRLQARAVAYTRERDVVTARVRITRR